MRWVQRFASFGKKKSEERLKNIYKDRVSEKFFDEEKMYTYVEKCANEHKMSETEKALPYAASMHKGQVRKGKEAVPYIYHPLVMVCHALALGIMDDEIIAAILLHDVCEDCQVENSELPVNEEIKKIVDLLTKKDEQDKKSYYKNIEANNKAMLIKLLDRCNNVSGMMAAFSNKKLIEYIDDTEKYIYPYFEKIESNCSDYTAALYVIKYHMVSVLDSIKRM